MDYCCHFIIVIQVKFILEWMVGPIVMIDYLILIILKPINHSIKMVIENGITFTDLLYRIQHNKELPQTVI